MGLSHLNNNKIFKISPRENMYYLLPLFFIIAKTVHCMDSELHYSEKKRSKTAEYLPIIVSKQRSKTDPDVVRYNNPEKQTRSTSISPTHYITDIDRIPRSESPVYRHKSSSSSASPSFISSLTSSADHVSRQDSNDSKYRRKNLSSPPPKKSKFIKLTSAIQRNKISLLNEYLSDPGNNPNIQNDSGNTLLFSSIFLRKVEAVKTLVSDPRIDSLIRNGEYKCAHEYAKESSPEIKGIVELRTTLDNILYAFLVTNELCFQEPLNIIKIKKRIKKLLNRIPSNTIPTYTSVEFVMGMIIYRLQHYRISLQKDFIEFSNTSNYKGIHDNTIVHLAAYLRDQVRIAQLIENPTIIFHIRNNSDCFSHTIFSLMDTGDIREQLFMRDSLECWALQAVEAALINYPTIDISALGPQSTFIKSIIRKVNLKAKKVKESQNSPDESDQDIQDRQLPSKTSDIPAYATNEFFLALIQSRLNERKPTEQKILFSPAYSQELIEYQQQISQGEQKNLKIIKNQITASLENKVKDFFKDIQIDIATEAQQMGIHNESFYVEVFKMLVEESFKAEKKALLQKYQNSEEPFSH